jgi:hypothetical protein
MHYIHFFILVNSQLFTKKEVCGERREERREARWKQVGRQAPCLRLCTEEYVRSYTDPGYQSERKTPGGRRNNHPG